MARLGLGLAHFATDHGNDKTALAKVKLHVWYDSERRRPAIRTPEVDASPLANFFSLVPDPSAWHAGFGSSTLFEDLWDIFGVHFPGLILGLALPWQRVFSHRFPPKSFWPSAFFVTTYLLWIGALVVTTWHRPPPDDNPLGQSSAARMLIGSGPSLSMSTPRELTVPTPREHTPRELALLTTKEQQADYLTKGLSCEHEAICKLVQGW
jgi:hypothetical protein